VSGFERERERVVIWDEGGWRVCYGLVWLIMYVSFLFNSFEMRLLLVFCSEEMYISVFRRLLRCGCSS
jgi:hypothetical protein